MPNAPRRQILFGFVALLVMGPSLGQAQSGTPAELVAPISLEDVTLTGGIYAQLRAQEATGLGELRLPRDLSVVLDQPLRSSPDFLNADPSRITVKFREGSGIRLRGGELRVESSGAARATLQRLLRTGIDVAVVEQDLTQLREAVRLNGVSLTRLAPRVAEADLDRLRLAAESNTGVEQPDLNLWYTLSVAEGADGQDLLSTLRAMRSVQYAYFEPIPEDAADIPPTTTICLHSQCAQPYIGYFGRAPAGIDVAFARQFRGGRGEGVNIIDVERRWLPDHEDLPGPSRVLIDQGLPITAAEDGSHGTAVVGQLWAVENRFGVTGITPRSNVGLIAPAPASSQSAREKNLAAALTEAGAYLSPGDIVLIEQQFMSKHFVACDPQRDQCGMVPTEIAPAVFDAIVLLINGGGLIVVEAAGNGGQRIDRPSASDPVGTTPSDRFIVPDSGAIMVAAAHSVTRAPSSFTNYGTRVDVHAWGDSIRTLGPGFNDDNTRRANGDDPLQVYRTDFGGTSGASPIVTGAVALIQSTRRAAGLPPLNCKDMRDLLRSTGSGLAEHQDRIGTMPNLRDAIATYRARRN